MSGLDDLPPYKATDTLLGEFGPVEVPEDVTRMVHALRFAMRLRLNEEQRGAVLASLNEDWCREPYCGASSDCRCWDDS